MDQLIGNRYFTADEAAAPMRDALAKNRTEEFGDDVWKQFVVPPFFDKLDLHTAGKPRVIVGGRGCGKTMLLRYFCHETSFSPHREKIPNEAIQHVGLYWRADTHFASAMQQRGIEEDEWDSAFAHAFALALGLELVRSLDTIACSSYSGLTAEDLHNLDLSRLQSFDESLPSTIQGLAAALEGKQWALESWVSNVRRSEPPLFLPGASFLKRFVDLVRAGIPGLQNIAFCIYVDEYENLLPSQRRIINSWLKHARNPLMLHVAVKRNAFELRSTTGSEALVNIHDFRYHKLDEYYDTGAFPVFAAEILFHRLHEGGMREVPVNPLILRRPDRLSVRRNSEYAQLVVQAAEALLPGMTASELARSVFNDAALSRKLRQRIAAALKDVGSKEEVDTFFRPELPEASIISPALLYRRKLTPRLIASELDCLEAGKPNRYTGATAWIHNNLIAALLQLYDPGSRPCPFYAGFTTFCTLARGNLRHFLELCHRSLQQELAEQVSPTWEPILVERQAEAAREASVTFLHEIRSFGDRGDHLRTFVLRLGTLFELAHRRPSLSENEQSHFSIERGQEPLSDDDIAFLKEATKWSVLIEEESTKIKADDIVESVDYVLNPIYSPYFYISYRKKRKLVLSCDEVTTLIRGSADDVTELLRRYKRKWSVEKDDAALSLFSVLDAEKER